MSPAKGSHLAAGLSVKDSVQQGFSEGRGDQLMREIKLSQTLDWSKTAVIEGDIQGKPYELEDFAAAIDGRVASKDIIAIVTTNRNNIVLASFKTEASLQKAAATQGIIVKGLSADIYLANPTRVMWLTLSGVPHQISNSVVAELFKFYGRVVVTRSVFMTGRFAHIMTGSKKVLLEVKAGFSAEDIPYELQVKGHNIIVNIAGRRLRCLKCGEFGHKRKDCVTPRCTTCHKFGHQADACTGTRTYASAVDGFPALQQQGRQEDSPPTDVSDPVPETTLPIASPVEPNDHISDNGTFTSSDGPPFVAPSDTSTDVQTAFTFLPPDNIPSPIEPALEVENLSWADTMENESPLESDDASSDTVELKDSRKLRAVDISAPKPARRKTTYPQKERLQRKVKKRGTDSPPRVPSVVLTDAGFAAAVAASMTNEAMDTETKNSQNA